MQEQIYISKLYLCTLYAVKQKSNLPQRFNLRLQVVKLWRGARVRRVTSPLPRLAECDASGVGGEQLGPAGDGDGEVPVLQQAGRQVQNELWQSDTTNKLGKFVTENVCIECDEIPAARPMNNSVIFFCYVLVSSSV